MKIIEDAIIKKIANIIHNDNVNYGMAYADNPELFEIRQAKAIYTYIFKKLPISIALDSCLIKSIELREKD